MRESSTLYGNKQALQSAKTEIPRTGGIRRLALGAAVALAAAIGMSGGEAQAALIYQTCNGATLCTVDTDTGAVATIGSFGVGSTFGTAFDIDGTLYATTGSNSLATVNLSTGAATILGALPSQTYAINFDSQGQLFAFATNGGLYQLDKTTGAGTLIANTGITSMMDIAFDSSDTLFGVTGGRLYQFDTGSGAVLSNIATSLGSANMGIMFDADDTLWATLYTGNSGLYTLDTTTGIGTLVHAAGLSAPHGGDIFVPPPVSVPAPASLALFGIGLAALGFARRRRPPAAA